MPKKLPEHINIEVNRLIQEMIAYIDEHGLDITYMTYDIRQSQSVLLYRGKAYEYYKDRLFKNEWTRDERVEFLHAFGRKTTKLMFLKIDYPDFKAKYIK